MRCWIVCGVVGCNAPAGQWIDRGMYSLLQTLSAALFSISMLVARKIRIAKTKPVVRKGEAGRRYPVVLFHDGGWCG